MIENLPKLRGQRLKWMRNIANLSQQAFCERHDFNLSTLKGWETGRHGGLTEKAAEKIIIALTHENISCSLSWLLYNTGDKPKLVDKSTIVPSQHEQYILDELNLFREHTGDILSYLMQDDSMLPHYKVGALVAGPRYQQSDMLKLIKHDCIVETSAGLLCRYLNQMDDQYRATLTCLNHQASVEKTVLQQVKIISVAPIIWQRLKAYPS